MGFADPTRAPRRTSCDGFSAPTRNRVQQREAKARAARDRAADELAEQEREQRRRGYKGPRVAFKPTVQSVSAEAAEAAEYRAWAERAAEAASANAAAQKPALSEGKMRDYGYGVPAWSPYYIHPKLKDYFGKRVPTTSAPTTATTCITSTPARRPTRSSSARGAHEHHRAERARDDRPRLGRCSAPPVRRRGRPRVTHMQQDRGGARRRRGGAPTRARGARRRRDARGRDSRTFEGGLRFP